MRAVELLVGDGDDAKAVFVKRDGLILACRRSGWHRARLSRRQSHTGGTPENLLDRAFANKKMFILAVRDNDRQAPPREVEGDFIDLAEAGVDIEDPVDVDVLQDGDIEKVLQARLKVTVQIGVLQDLFRFIAAEIQMALENDSVLRQRAGFVGAQYVHRAEILNGVEPFAGRYVSVRLTNGGVGRLDRRYRHAPVHDLTMRIPTTSSD